MQFFGQGKPPIGIIFDSDMGHNIGDALALAMIQGLEGKNETRLISMSVSRHSLKSAAFCDAVRGFYAAATNPQIRGFFFRGLPIGMAETGAEAEDTPMLTGPLSRKDEKGAPVFDHSIHRLVDTADPAPLIRNALTAQHDQNALVVLSGPATNLVRAMELSGVKDWISRKVHLLCAHMGTFPAGQPEAHVKADIAAAKKLFEEWPSPIVAVGSEVGEALKFPASSIEKDFGWAPAHPVADAYRAAGTMPYDAPAGAMAAALYTVRTKENYFKVSEPGTIQVAADGSTKFAASAEGRHRYLIVDPSQQEKVIKAFTELASAKPVPRQFRFRTDQQKKQAAPPKQTPPAEPKP